MTPYQLLPDLLPEEYDTLKASIAENGVQVPIVVDQDGNTIDGFHRERACQELGIECPREIRHFASENEKLELGLRLNCCRRMLNGKQKRALIAVYLCRDPEIADNHLGELIGVSGNTVGKVRNELEGTSQIEKFEKLRGKDGKTRPTKYRKIIANTAKEAEAAQKIIGDLPANCDGKTLDVTSAARRARRSKTKIERQRRIEEARENVLPGSISIHHCDLRDLEIEPESIDLIMTDVMWDEASESDWRALGEKAMKWLKPEGLLASYIGQRQMFALARVLQDAGLHDQWCFCAEFDPGRNAAEVNGILGRWRPVVVFSREKQHVFRKTIDTFPIGPQEKEWSHLQQTVQGVRWLLEHLSDPGDTVLDICMGTGTTAVAVLTASDGPRRFIGCDRNEEMVKIAQHRVSETSRLRTKILDDLECWIGDAQDDTKTTRSEIMRYWDRFIKRDRSEFPYYLKLLPAEYQAIWASLAP